jgi:hypothetical protein
MRNVWRRFAATVAVVGCLCVPASGAGQAQWYKVNITRIDQDLYRDSNSRRLIETRYCYEYVYYEDARLRWENAYGNNKLIFRSNRTCDVVGLH